MKKTFILLMSASVLFSGILVSCKKKEDNKEKKPEVEYKSFTIDKTSFKMIAVKGGSFNMGAQNKDKKGANYYEDALDFEAPVHKVVLSDYYIGEFEVTQALWMAVMAKDNKDYNNPSHFGKYPLNAEDGNLPVDGVSWDDICKNDGFIDKLNKLLESQLPKGKRLRLPTEAEWEFAARGGAKHDASKNWLYSGSSDAGEVGWVFDNSQIEGVASVHAVGGKKANELGLYDMTGNVWELCSDWYDREYYKKSPEKDPKGPDVPNSGEEKIMRGGAANSVNYDESRVSLRNYIYYKNGAEFAVLRLAL